MTDGGVIMFCAKCGNETSEGVKFCPNCGQSAESSEIYNEERSYDNQTTYQGQNGYSNDNATNHGDGYSYQSSYSGQNTSYQQYNQSPIYNGMPMQKSKIAAGLLQIFLGGFGVGRFYLGYTGMGVAQLLVTFVTCGIGAIWPFIDGILILCGQVPNDANGVPLKD